MGLQYRCCTDRIVRLVTLNGNGADGCGIRTGIPASRAGSHSGHSEAGARSAWLRLPVRDLGDADLCKYGNVTL